MLTRRAFLGSVGAVFAGCRSLDVPGGVTADEVLAVAESYRLHRWRPTLANAFHGRDREGIRVDTPDVGYRPPGSRPGWWVPGATNLGMPYQWGGFDTPESFDRKLAEGLAAGDVYTSLKRKLLYDGVSRRACGIDCSGFISRCWQLPKAYSTRELQGICEPLREFSDLRAGDLLNKHNVHALLFDRWLDGGKTSFVAYDTGSEPTWKVLRHAIAVDFVTGKGYRPFRYRGIRVG